MKKRLIAAVLMVGAISATMVMGASAFWTTNTVTTTAAYSAGNASIQVEWQQGCTGAWVVVGPTINAGATGVPLGYSSTSCVRVTNTGTVPINVFSRNQAFSGNASLYSQLNFQLSGGNCNPAGPAPANDPAYTSGNGWQVFTNLAPGGQGICALTTSLPNDPNTNQDNIQNQSAGWTNVLFGIS